MVLNALIMVRVQLGPSNYDDDDDVVAAAAVAAAPAVALPWLNCRH